MNNLLKLRTTDGAIMLNPFAGAWEGGLVFDGANIWLNGGTNVEEFRASDGALLGQFPGSGGTSGAIAFDGANIWSVNGNGGSVLKY